MLTLERDVLMYFGRSTAFLKFQNAAPSSIRRLHPATTQYQIYFFISDTFLNE